ncbi:Single-stranded DNA-binding protein [Anopheles sinensis]|uniref:Single-stranded DNA-binding protein n=1 Tax=Anopheles sinensis TaxID=74873 RepID=A0A084VTZ6_ANOSI|nr:Single-stranded DNA-binding protein [Anopheles sinensis]
MPEVSIEDEMELQTCKNLVKLNVLLRSTINHVLVQRYDRNFNFSAARTDRSSFDQLRNWVNCYEKIKKESAAEKAQQESPQDD